MADRRLLITVHGTVQGVGFRPFVFAAATRLGLGGTVANSRDGVVVEIEGDAGQIERFLAALAREAPPLAIVDRVASREVPCRGDTAFSIAPSADGDGAKRTTVPADAATCADCLRELLDHADRRFRYPFITCTNCGPRFTIVRDVPYDRAATTMAPFPMCAACAREYGDPRNRRFHAEPIACPACGPSLALLDAAGARVDGDPIGAAAAAILSARVVAIKGLGGYHLAADASSEAAVAALRARKHRHDKPFALMATDLDAARGAAHVSDAEARLLADPRAPIVLLARRAGAPVAPLVAPGTREVGIMLPYTPLHHLLLREVGKPIVLTSGNVSDEPIAYRDGEARARLGGIADLFLTHDRAIHVRTDDSVVRTFRGAPMPLRRSRGYVPQPIALPVALPEPVLACGAELKSTICVAAGARALVSHHIGDLENYETFRSFTEAIEAFQRLADARPTVIAHDLHPEYLSTKWAREQADARLVGVQHHHAHIASCMADNGHADPVIGVAFDGLGYGADGTLWGGEFLIASFAGYERVGHLAAVPMPGGSAAIREPWRMAAVQLDRAFEGEVPALAIRRRHGARWSAVLSVARTRALAPLTSSAGRLFDAIAALLDVRDVATYEGQAAIELEQLADVDERGSYAASLRPAADGFECDGADLVRAAAEDSLAGVAPAIVAARFHNAMAELIAAGCAMARARSGLATVALSGGVFQNALLLDRAVTRLETSGFAVLRHRHVPPNDGGICLGQAVIAGHALAVGPAAG